MVTDTYLYLENLFKTVLAGSSKIEGRFYVTHKYGAQEINFDVVSDLIGELPQNKTYPLALMPPPHVYGKLTEKMGDWERYRIIMLFVDTTYYSGTKVNAANTKTKTSTKTVQNHWSEMKICANDFLRGLHTLQRKLKPAYFRLPNYEVLTVPISATGVDRVSGVRMTFDMELFTGCEIQDYEPDYFKNLDINGL